MGGFFKAEAKITSCRLQQVQQQERQQKQRQQVQRQERQQKQRQQQVREQLQERVLVQGPLLFYRKQTVQ